MKLNATNTAIIKRLLLGRSSRPLLSILSRVEPVDLASLITHLPERESLLLFEALTRIHRASEVLIEVPEQHLFRILDNLSPSALLNLLIYAAEEDAAYFLGLLTEDQKQELLLQMETPKRNRIQQFLDYPAGSAGRIMQTQFFSIPIDMTAAEAIDRIRAKANEISIYYIFCVNEDNKLAGVVSLRVLATSAADKNLMDLVKRDLVTCTPQTPAKEVAKLVARYDFVALPVVDPSHRMIGVVTVDDVLDIIQEEATANIYASAGLQENDRVFTPALQSIRNRMPWMLLNLVLAALASSVVALFERTMTELIILATLKNIVAGIGGNTAIQSLTVVTRGIATGDFSFISNAKAIWKETIVGLTLGTCAGILSGIFVYLWKGDLLVSFVIFTSMVLNSLVASGFGSLVPILLNRMGRDPAVGSGVIATMITDIFGFFSFLGIAALGLHLVGR